VRLCAQMPPGRAGIRRRRGDSGGYKTQDSIPEGRLMIFYRRGCCKPGMRGSRLAIPGSPCAASTARIQRTIVAANLDTSGVVSPVNSVRIFQVIILAGYP
jgi:malonyl CoA-acyl carrier protein transacylase